MNLVNIISEFQIQGKVLEITAIESGHINTTYAVTSENESNTDYILQKINCTVFQNIQELTSNTIRITNHITEKISQNAGSFVHEDSLCVVYTKGGSGFYQDNEGSYWRVFKMISETNTIEILSNKSQANLIGRALGEFHQLLSDLPPTALYDTIPKFHDTLHRIEQLKDSIRKNTVGRLPAISKDINCVLSFEAEIKEGLKNMLHDEIPSRVIHQDPKLGNLLFDKDNNVVCLIDLDTTMNGYLCYDFGDAVRGGMNTSKEDEIDLRRTSINMEFFKAFTIGYCNSTKSFILPEEVMTLAFGVKLITYEQTIRFFTDYLNGDVYYKTQLKDHNLIRARCQLELSKKARQQYPLMHKFVLESYAKI